MATISTVTDRSDGEVLTGAKYNTDHGVHETNATNLNTDKLETSVNEAQHDSSGFHVYAESAASLQIATGDTPHFTAVVASGDQSHFATADFAGLLTADRFFTTADALMSGDVRSTTKFIATVDVNQFATSDFAGGATVDYLTVNRIAPTTFTASDLGKVFLNMTPNVFALFADSPLAISADVNVETIAQDATGIYALSFSATLDSRNYFAIASGGRKSDAIIVNVTTQDAGKVEFNCRSDANVLSDIEFASVGIFGGKTTLP